MKKSIKICMVLFLCITLPCLYISTSALLLKKASITFFGFGVDSLNHIYVGKSNGINVFSDGELIKIINPKTSRDYKFTIDKNDIIILSTISNVYEMDTDGQIIKKYPDSDGKIFRKLQSIRTFESVDNDIYTVKNMLGRPEIVKNDSEVVYIMPTFDFVVKILMIVACVSFFPLAVPVILYLTKVSQINQKKQSMNPRTVRNH